MTTDRAERSGFVEFRMIFFTTWFALVLSFSSFFCDFKFYFNILCLFFLL